MRILITGGTGYIGQTLCPRLIDAGHELFIFSRQPDRVAGLYGSGAEGFDDMNRIPAIKPEAVINLAGEPIAGGRWTDSRKKKLRDSRIALTEELCRRLAETDSPPGIFISGSAVGYYGDGGDRILTEDATPNHEFAQQLCADWEAAADGARAWDARVVKLRIGLVMGPGGGFLGPLKLPFRLGLGSRLGSGEQWMSWISKRDMVRIIEFVLDNPVTGAFNACAPNPVTNREFTRAFAKACRRPVFPIGAPAFALSLALGEMSALLLHGQRAVPERLLEAGFEFELPALDATLAVALET